MKQYPQAIIEEAHKTIFGQRSLLLCVRRTAWWLFEYELRRGHPPEAALDHVLKWMAEQLDMLERVKREPTQLQRHLLQMLADGKSQKQIALELGIRVGSVRVRFARLRKRVGADSLFQVMAIAAKKRWVKVSENPPPIVWKD